VHADGRLDRFVGAAISRRYDRAAMTLHDVEPDDRLAAALRLFAEVSAVASADDVMHAFVRRVGGLLPLCGWVDVLFDLGAAPRPRAAMAYRVVDRTWVEPDVGGADGGAAETVRRACRWPDAASWPLDRGGIVARMLDGADGPRILEPVPDDAAGDPVLGPVLRGVRSILAVPVFRAGRPAQWTLVFRRDPGWSEADVRIAVQVMNLRSTVLEARHALARADALHGDLRGRIDELGRVQRSILPALPEQVPGLRTAVHYRPCETAGGDYYDHRRFADGRFGLLVADVSGHGPAASVVMAMLRTAFSAYRAFRFRAITVVGDVNRVLRESLGDGTFVTAFFVALDVVSGDATSANSGHPPARVLLGDGRIEALDEDAAPPLGIVDELEPRGGVVRLAPGDRVVLFTDGIVETRDPGGRMLGLDGLDAVLAGLSRAATPERIVEAIVDAADRHAEGCPPADDRCVLVVERTRTT